MAFFRPTFIKQKLTCVTPDDLRAWGVRGLLLDVDNTLSTHHSQTPLPGVEAWLADMRQGGIGLLIVSNARRERVRPFAQRLGLPFVWLCKKPLPFALRRAVKRLGVPRGQVLLCGDQLFTDMLGGHLAGLKTLLVTPAKPEEKWNFRLRRALERPLLRRYQRKDETK